MRAHGKAGEMRFGAGALGVALLVASWGCSVSKVRTDPLPSWNEGPARSAILEMVSEVTNESGASYVPPGERVATFDNDGTLWVEHPLYTQAIFALDRIRALAPEHPDWQTKAPYRQVLSGDPEALAKLDRRDWVEILAVTHTGMSTEDFEKIADAWISTARDERFGRKYTELVFQPMLEVLQLLRSKGFETFIVSGGGVEFIRAFSEEGYGIPTSQVVGSSVVTRFEEREGSPVLLREPEVFFLDDKAGKPIGIQLFVGKRPIAAFGNTDGDKEMLEWTTAGQGQRLGMLVLHDDAEREYAYGPAAGLPDTRVGRFSQELYEQARNRGWIVVSMKKDWKRIFAWE